jgi:hypothetical protein
VLDARCKRCGHRFPLPDDWSGRIPECPNCRIQCEATSFGEQEWLAETDPNPMLSCLHGKASDRKLRLFIANYCRRTWRLFQDERCRRAIEVAERSADGQVGDEELLQVYIQMWEIQGHIPCPAPEAIIADSCRRAVRPSGRITPRIVGIAAESLARVVAEGTGGESERGAWGEAKQAAWEAERWVQVDFLRDIFGNPFRPVAFNPSWRTPDVVTLAGHIYHDRAFAELPDLAEALEAAGCADPTVLAHCREPGPHVRGCFVVDLLLAKK